MADQRPFSITTKPKIHAFFANPLAEPGLNRIGNRTIEHSNFVRYFHRKLLGHASLRISNPSPQFPFQTGTILSDAFANGVVTRVESRQWRIQYLARAILIASHHWLDGRRFYKC